MAVQMELGGWEPVLLAVPLVPKLRLGRSALGDHGLCNVEDLNCTLEGRGEYAVKSRRCRLDIPAMWQRRTRAPFAACAVHWRTLPLQLGSRRLGRRQLDNELV